MRKNYVQEIILIVIVAVWLLFTATNVNATLGQTYLHFAWITAALLIVGITVFDKKLSITFQKSPGGHLKAFGAGLMGWGILLILSVVVMRFVDPAQASLGAIVGLLGAATPALATSKVVNWLNFSIAIPFAETQLWGRMQEFFADVFGIRLDKKGLKTFGMIALIAILSVVFLAFHLTAKGITAYATLAVVFLMMAISLVMVVWFGETRQAVYFHIIANGVAAYLLIF